MLVHLTARTRGARPLLDDWKTAEELWRYLRDAFPAALAAVLMPNHPHLVTEARDCAAAQHRFAYALRALTRTARRAGARDVAGWDPVPPAVIIPDVKHFQRVVRYVLLNPCRAGLVRDPLAWTWTTHRDVVGAVADPWVEAARLAAALGVSARGFAGRHHAYVSGDPSCRVAGTAPPRPAVPSDVPRFPLARILAAAAAATRSPTAAILTRSASRNLFVQLAVRHGWQSTALLARAAGVSLQAILQLRRRPAAGLLPAGELCLGDDRLLAPWLGGCGAVLAEGGVRRGVLRRAG